MRIISGVSHVLDSVLETEPDRVAIVGRHRTLTYRDLDAAADAGAGVFADRGVRPGDRVAACLPNDSDIVVAFHAAMRLGAVWVGVNQALALPEKLALLKDAGPTLTIGGPDLARELSAAVREHGFRFVTADASDPDAQWSRLLAAAAGAGRRPSPDPYQPAAIAYTSGTTGLPRGVVHSQHNLLLPGAALVASRRYGPQLRKGDFLPLTILNLMVLTTLLTAQAGGRCVLMDRRDVGGVVDWIERESVTVWNGVPALLYSMVQDPNLAPDALRSLDEVWTGGADCPEHLRRAFADRFGVRVYATYGLTEAPTVVTMDPLDGEHVAGSSGKPLPHLEVRIIDDAGRSLPEGDLGEIAVRAVQAGPWRNTYTPMLGYWRDPEPAADGVAAGDLRTGDIGSLDNDQNLFVRDRKKLVVIRGGANIYPAEVERVLSRAPGVHGCAVLGIPDERLGQRVVAVVSALPGTTVSEDALRTFCAEHLAKYKVPERFLVVDDIPRNAMGKVERAKLISLFQR